ncbi:hypothetical protein Tsubulata_017030 [Turnera subulata]|uniref:Tropomyosin n=1 Tax=Turnera subulata TaxID=218843 RepID=A0A9Q0FH04_9ROSI|nr:hypothetical protein Tsubulata_017030 [Turnera subulata]
MGMAVNVVLLIPAILSSLLVLSIATQDQQLQASLHESNLRVAELESTLMEINEAIKARELYLEESESQIDEMDKEIIHLQSTLSNMKADEKIDALEEEARVLWAALRKNNFDIHVVETKAKEAEARLETATLQVEEMEDIVAEQWIQIQQFEQALQLRQMRALKARKQASPLRYAFLKVVSRCFALCLSRSSLQFCISLTSQQLNRLFSRVKEFHHELQASIKQEMERYELTACLANQELVFFVASALIIFPVMGAWILLSSQLR